MRGSLLHTGDVVDALARFPDRLPAGKQAGSGDWVKVPGRIALVDDEAQSVTIFAGAEPPDPGDSRLRPVYALSGSRPAAPTGRVYLRFDPEVDARSRADEIATAGFAIERTVSYAPHTVWLRVESGDAADALSRLPTLEQLPGVANVEPQMLSVRETRSDTKTVRSGPIPS